MSKTEQIMVGLVAGFLCPLLFFVFFWWTSAALVMSGILAIPNGGIAAAAFTGLALGIILNVVCLKRWISHFYTASLKRLVPVYLCCSVIAVAFFMGLPLGNLALGTLAGVYVGRREHHTGGGWNSIIRVARRTGIFTASVMGVESLPIGLLALREGTVQRLLHVGLGMEKETTAGPMGIGLAILTSAALMALQYVCTRAATRLAFGRG